MGESGQERGKFSGPRTSLKLGGRSSMLGPSCLKAGFLTGLSCQAVSL